MTVDGVNRKVHNTGNNGSRRLNNTVISDGVQQQAAHDLNAHPVSTAALVVLLSAFAEVQLLLLQCTKCKAACVN